MFNLAPEHDPGAQLLTPIGYQKFDRQFAMNSRDRVQRDLGSDFVSYLGVPSVDSLLRTLWRVTIYGELLFAGDPAARQLVNRGIAAIGGGAAGAMQHL